MAPSFPSSERAAELFFRDEPLAGVPPRKSEMLLIRAQQDQARIERVVFSAGAVEIELAATGGPHSNRVNGKRALRDSRSGESCGKSPNHLRWRP